MAPFSRLERTADELARNGLHAVTDDREARDRKARVEKVAKEGRRVIAEDLAIEQRKQALERLAVQIIDKLFPLISANADATVEWRNIKAINDQVLKTTQVEVRDFDEFVKHLQHVTAAVKAGAAYEGLKFQKEADECLQLLLKQERFEQRLKMLIDRKEPGQLLELKNILKELLDEITTEQVDLSRLAA